jgi:Ca2+-binding EF-hand superfamily protein
MSITEKQLNTVVARVFIKYDMDEDGYLDRDEIK